MQSLQRRIPRLLLATLAALIVSAAFAPVVLADVPEDVFGLGGVVTLKADWDPGTGYHETTVAAYPGGLARVVYEYSRAETSSYATVRLADTSARTHMPPEPTGTGHDVAYRVVAAPVQRLMSSATTGAAISNVRVDLDTGFRPLPRPTTSFTDTHYSLVVPRPGLLLVRYAYSLNAPDAELSFNFDGDKTVHRAAEEGYGGFRDVVTAHFVSAGFHDFWIERKSAGLVDLEAAESERFTPVLPLNSYNPDIWTPGVIDSSPATGSVVATTWVGIPEDAEVAVGYRYRLDSADATLAIVLGGKVRATHSAAVEGFGVVRERVLRLPSRPGDREFGFRAVRGRAYVQGVTAGIRPYRLFTRMAGSTMYDTSIAVSQRSFPNGFVIVPLQQKPVRAAAVPEYARAVVLASGTSFPDQACAAPLARLLGGPLLLTGAVYDGALEAEIVRLGSPQIVIVGGEAAVPKAIEDALRSRFGLVRRIYGANRYATAAEVAEQFRRRLKYGERFRAFVVNARRFPDALAAAPVAAREGLPIVFTESDWLPRATISAIRPMPDGQSSFCVVVGSRVSVSDAVFHDLPQSVRVGGADRFATWGLLADRAKASGASYAYTALATSQNFPDGLAAAPLVAKRNGILLLSPPTYVPGPVKQRMQANRAQFADVDLVGGRSALPDPLVDQVRLLLRDPALP